MPIVFEDELRNDIKNKRFANVYLIYGDDSYLKNYYKDTLAKKSSDGDPFFNLQKFEGDIDLQEVFDAVNQFPMMAERKSVLLCDYDFSKGDFDRLLELISNANDKV
jgi:DNA polymerase-3 subunit delta